MFCPANSRSHSCSRFACPPPLPCLILFIILFFSFLTIGLGAQDQSNGIQLSNEQAEDGTVRFYANSEFLIPVYLFVEFSELRNMTPNVSLPFGVELEPGIKQLYLFSLSINDKTASSSYSYRYQHSWGNPSTVSPDENYLYTFPYAHGTKQGVTQGFNGNFTHKNENSYAVDFDLEVGTEIFAARGGVVAVVKEDSNVGGRGLQYSKHGNFVMIMHSDGTFGNYVHLRQNGAIVEEGAEVRTGQLIGYSGNTGQSSGPHLHFDVRIPQLNGKMQSIPILFKGLDGEAVLPEENSFYYSAHEGGSPFEVSYGADLRNEDFAGYLDRARKANTIDIRTEQIDKTFLLFIGNGFNYGIEAQVSFRLTSMTSTTAIPITISLSAGEEKFLTILRPQRGVSSSGYRSSVSYRRN